jgi:hypothetical protein
MRERDEQPGTKGEAPLEPDVTLGVPSLDVPALLSLLPAIEADIEAEERRLRACVRMLRARRATWREIGDALQVSRQAAWERFQTS